MFDDWQSIVWLVASVLIAYGVILWFGTIVWAYRDMHERTRDGWSQAVAVLLIVFFNFPGLFLYLILRPHETLAEAYERRLEAEALTRDLPEERPSCPSCRRQTSDEFLFCPYCQTKLRRPCSACGRSMELNWTACPYCGDDGMQALVTATRPKESQRPASPTGPPVHRPASQAPEPTASE